MSTPDHQQLARETAEKCFKIHHDWETDQACPPLMELRRITSEAILAALSAATEPLRYGHGQHELVCQDVGCSADPSAPGPSAHEAVQEIILGRDSLRAEVERLKEGKNT